MAAAAGVPLAANNIVNIIAVIHRDTPGPKSRFLGELITSSVGRQRCGGGRSRNLIWQSARQQKSLPWVDYSSKPKASLRIVLQPPMHIVK